MPGPLRIYDKQRKCKICGSNNFYVRNMKCVSCACKRASESSRSTMSLKLPGTTYCDGVQDTRCEGFRNREYMIMEGVSYAG